MLHKYQIASGCLQSPLLSTGIRQASVNNMTLLRKYKFVHVKDRDVIIPSCLNLTTTLLNRRSLYEEVRAWNNNYITCFCMGVLTYPRVNLIYIICAHYTKSLHFTTLRPRLLIWIIWNFTSQILDHVNIVFFIFWNGPPLNWGEAILQGWKLGKWGPFRCQPS